MKNIILFDPDSRDQLLPLTYTRPVCGLRVGILTIEEKWAKMLGGQVSYITQDYLSTKFPINISADNFVVNGAVLPDATLCAMIETLNANEALLKNGELIAARLNESQIYDLMEKADEDLDALVGFELETMAVQSVRHVWDIFGLNDAAIRADFALLTAGRTSAPLSTSNTLIGSPDQIFIEEGAVVEAAVLNVKTGPIYIAQQAEIMEGCLVRGPFALCEESQLKMGAKIYGATTIGPHSKVGGEVNNAVFLGYSNKGHDGFLGNAVLGEWCNMGADSNNSNLKNTYEEVKLWDYTKEGFNKTGLQFLGLIMGDHSKCGINTMFNTGTVVGVSANVFGAGFPRNFIPSFTWGGAQSIETYQFAKACDTAERVMARRGVALSADDRAILQHVFDYSAKFRPWDKK